MANIADVPRHRREWGTGSVHAVKGGRYWRVAISLPADPFGQRRRKEWQFRDPEAAQRWLEKVQYRLRRGLPPEESAVTLGEYAVEWLGSIESRVKPSTWAMYDSLVRVQLRDLSDVRLTRIGAPEIRALLQAKERQGYSGRTRRGILDVLRMILRLAQNDGIVERNVAELVDPPRIDAKEPVHFTAEQARCFLEAAKDDNLYSLYAVALSTGLRRGEVLALTWRDIRLEDDAVTVRRGKTAASARTVPLPAFAASALRGVERRPGPIWPYDPSYVTRHVGVICQRAGLPRITFHGLRHSAASILLAEGVPMEIIRQILGHTTVKMSGHYARAEDDMKREALERLGKAVAG